MQYISSLNNTGIDIVPTSGSLSGGTVLTLSGSVLYENGLMNQSEVTVNIGGIPCEVYFRYGTAPCSSSAFVRNNIICGPIFYV